VTRSNKQTGHFSILPAKVCVHHLEHGAALFQLDPFHDNSGEMDYGARHTRSRSVVDRSQIGDEVCRVCRAQIVSRPLPVADGDHLRDARGSARCRRPRAGARDRAARLHADLAAPAGPGQPALGRPLAVSDRRPYIEAMSSLATRSQSGRPLSRPLRRLFEAGAGLLGVAAGVLLAEPVLAAAGVVWRGYFLPAYDELIKNGLLAWCM